MYYKTSKSDKNNLREQDQEIEAHLPFFEAQAIVLVRVKRPKILTTKNKIWNFDIFNLPLKYKPHLPFKRGILRWAI